ncbi:MAG: hypothetical protein JNM76_02245 [Betaproteobacteria bacterium]|nr:hypothetical protein [Betaproteobacteria bacterium]
MLTRKTAFAALASLSLLLGAAPVLADDAKDHDKFVKMCDTNKDGMVSKDEFMKHAEKIWEKMDAKKVGKMDSKQFELFLKQLMKSDG